MPDTDPTKKLHGLDPGELLARSLDTVKPTGGASAWEPPTPEELAKLLPQYRIESLLGRGGMGAVYKGVQAALERPVAIKLLPAELAGDGDFLVRFQREARTLAKLQHPGIVTVYDFGQTSAGHLYFVMEFVDGTDLQHVMKGPGLQPAQAFEMIAQICDALFYAHGQGVIHRDIKPANILVTKAGRAKVADFGLARPLIEDDGSLTATNVIMGTPDYMAPEQRSGIGHTDHRADIFALGVMLYEMLTGQRPHGAFQPPSHRVQVDVRIDEVVLKALQQEPDRRYQQASEMKVDVDRIRTTPPVSAKSGLFPWRRAALIAASLLSLIALGFAIPAILRSLAQRSIPAVASGKSELEPSGNESWKLPWKKAAWSDQGRAQLTADGWFTVGDELKSLDPQRNFGNIVQFADGAIRAQVRFETIQTKFPPAIGFWLRLPSEQSIQFLITETELKATLNGSKGAELGRVVFDTPFRPGNVEPFEAAAVGDRFVARFKGKQLRFQCPQANRSGLITIHGRAYGVKDVEYAILDGVADPLKALGWKVPVPADPVASVEKPAAATAASTPPSGVNTTPSAAIHGPPAGALQFGKSHYLVVQEQHSWPDAKKRAEKMGGHLATITSPEEQQWMADNLLKLGVYCCWIGAFRADDGQWKWVTGEPFQFTAWETPNLPDSKAERNYAYIRRIGPHIDGETRAKWCNRDETGEDVGGKPGTVFYPYFIVEWDAPAASSTVTPVPAAEEGFRPLFDGKTLAGWRALDHDVPATDWRVADGSLTGTPRSCLMTKEEFGDFDFRWDWRVSPKGNGGVYFHVAEDGMKERPMKAIEFQLVDDSLAGNPREVTGSAEEMHPATEKASHPPGEWNTARLLVQGTLVEHWINDRLVCRYDLADPVTPEAIRQTKKGRLALQAWGGGVLYRHLRIRETGTAPSTATPQPPGKNATAATPPRSGLIPEGALEFKGHHYLFVAGNISWSKAKAKAEGMNGHLVTFGDEDELNWVKENVAKPHFAAAPKQIWVGATKAAAGAPWQWVNGEPWPKDLPIRENVGNDPRNGNYPAYAKLLFYAETIRLFDASETAEGGAHWQNENIGFIVEWDAATPQAPPASAEKPGSTAAEQIVAWVFKYGGNVTILAHGGKEMKVSDAKQIPDGPFDILEIYVKGEFVTDAEFALLSQAPRLRNIRLDLDNHLTSLKPLAGLKELTSLSLAHPSSGTCRELSEREVAHLAGLTRLKFLDLRLKESTGEECEYLRELKSLTSLNVGNVRLSAKGAETIASLTQLKSLSMVIPDDASEKNLGPIGKLANLEFLALRDSVVTAQSFSVISQLPKLRKLDLSGAKLDNAGFALITGSRGTMKVLNVDMSANVSDEGIRNIVANFPNLEEINLSMGSTCTGASIRELAKLPQLKKMSCWVMKGLKPNDYILFADLPAIEHLSFEGTAITDEALPAFQKCQHLQTLNLPNNAITDAGLEHLKNILSLRNLKLQGTNVTDAGLAAFQQARPVVTVTR